MLATPVPSPEAGQTSLSLPEQVSTTLLLEPAPLRIVYRSPAPVLASGRVGDRSAEPVSNAITASWCEALSARSVVWASSGAGLVSPATAT